jgi:hypothetical protein
MTAAAQHPQDRSTRIRRKAARRFFNTRFPIDLHRHRAGGDDALRVTQAAARSLRGAVPARKT